MQSPQFLLTLALALLTSCIAVEGESERPAFALAIHGGAGTITRADLTPEMEAAYLEALEAALRSGHAVLTSGGSSVDAVVATLELMERSELFNAGVGAVFTSAGECELDASIMDGALHQAGAVAGVRTTSSPIRLAREVMRHSPHVMLAGSGADSWAAERGLEQVDNEHFRTERRREQLERVQREQQAGLAARTSDRVGTVGCVALDADGHLAAGTSTGGMTNKRWGRVGDSPIVGAGTWADDATCAISATGHGEYFIRAAVAHDIHARMAHGGHSLASAAEQVIQGVLGELGGSGGVVAMDARGHVVYEFNTEGMYRGSITAAGEVELAIYADDD